MLFADRSDCFLVRFVDLACGSSSIASGFGLGGATAFADIFYPSVACAHEWTETCAAIVAVMIEPRL